MQRKLLSTGIIAYNCADWIWRALDSAKIFSDNILVAIDQKTNDNTREVVSRYTQNVKEVLWYLTNLI